MQPTDIGSAAHVRSIGDLAPSSGGSPLGSLVFVLLLALPFFVASYPLLSVALLTGGVAAAVLSRSFVRNLRRHHGAVRRITLPGLGTVEYRFTRT